MSGTRNFKNTLLLGLLLIVPVGLVLVAADKVMQLLRLIAASFSSIVAPDRPIGVLLLDLIVIAMFVLLCFLAGLLAQSRPGQRLQSSAENLLAQFFPGFGLVKRYLSSLKDGEDHAENFVPVIVQLDDAAQFGFEVERTTDGRVLVYVPDAPNPASGSLQFVDAGRITRSAITMREALRAIRQLGEQSADKMLRPRE